MMYYSQRKETHNDKLSKSNIPRAIDTSSSPEHQILKVVGCPIDCLQLQADCSTPKSSLLFIRMGPNDAYSHQGCPGMSSGVIGLSVIENYWPIAVYTTIKYYLAHCISKKNVSQMHVYYAWLMPTYVIVAWFVMIQPTNCAIHWRPRLSSILFYSYFDAGW